MSNYRNRRLCSVVLVAVAMWRAAAAPPTKPRAAAVAGTAAEVSWALCKDDASDQIVSWVDGQVVTDWAAEITKRERAIQGYLDDADPVRAEKYGFRSGQTPRLAWSWFRNNPVGFNGVPFVLFKTILDLDPNHAEPVVARHRSNLEARGDRAGRSGHACARVDARSHRRRTRSVRLRGRRCTPGQPTPVAASLRICVRESARRSSRSPPARGSKRRTVAGATRFQEHDSADCQGAHGRQGGELGTRPAEFREPRHHGSRVPLLRRLPCRPRDGVREDEVPSRHAQHGDRSAVLLEAADAHRRSAGRIRLRPRVDHSCEPRQYQAQYERRQGPVRRDVGQSASAAGNAVRLVSGANRSRKDSDSGGCRRVPERHQGSHCPGREDALHLPRRGQEQRVQTAAARHFRGPSRSDGCLWRRLGPCRDPCTSSGQQLSGIRPTGQSGQPVLLGLFEGERLARSTCRE